MTESIHRRPSLNEIAKNCQTAGYIGLAQRGEEVTVIDAGAVGDEKLHHGEGGVHNSEGEGCGGVVRVIPEVRAGAVRKEPGHQGKIVLGDGRMLVVSWIPSEDEKAVGLVYQIDGIL